jgi:imidazolonepropionase-like amidohydrolase
MKQTLLALLILFHVGKSSFGQVTHPDNGVRDQRSQYHLLKNATIHVDAKTTIQGGWLLINEDKIEKVGKDFDYPKSAFVIDLTGKHIYASFIDAYSDYGMPELKRQAGGSYYETQFTSKKEGAYAWNQAIKPEVNASDLFRVNAKNAEELRKIGFGAVVSHQKDGIVRGTSSLISLAETKENDALIRSEISNHFSFDKGNSTQSYPTSLMGVVALLRQTNYDAEWYKNGGKKRERNLSFDAFSKNLSLPLVFNGKNVLDLLRADKIGKEFNQKYILKSGGDEYQKIEDIKALNAHLIVPINFPKAIDVEDPLDAENVSLTELKHWEMAPANLSKLAENNIIFSITLSDLADKTTFFANLQKAISYGLNKTTALEAITTNPAKALKIDDLVGSLKSGLLANFIITNEEIFETKSKILENWVQGKKYLINDISLSNINGKYALTLANVNNLKLDISGENDKPVIEIIESDTIKIKTTVIRDKNYLNINYSKKDKGSLRLSGLINGNVINGEGRDEKGESFVWNATLEKKPEIKPAVDSTKKPESPKIGEVLYPFIAFGNTSKLIKEDFIIKNATVWTNEKEGNIKTDVLVRNGKIVSLGNNLAATPGLKVIDGTNKHLTNGIIDEHSHIALFSINEIETVSAEVRQEDVVDSEDIDIYRQLAGGVTTSQLLHGSADCIGGQSAIIKLKWGESPDKLIIDNSPKFIKFALGENVKRGNAAQAPNRYPSTRMGVEQVFIDAFTRAKAYKTEWANYNFQKIKTGLTAPRKDLELETLVEILDGKRNITCHSYVQSEINMLMKLSDSLGFKVNTLTHILEGYKVADKMKERNISASTFSDWWAYKMEVKEAIPYNAAIMNKVGVNTAINSDDAEMARRLNQEAAKTILYGGLSQTEAWKTVTLNPAKMLHLDNRLGSIKVGKDADLVLWNDNPLSIYAKPDKTIIDGVIYFEADKQAQKLKVTEIEKNRIIQKLLTEKSKGAATVKPAGTKKPAQVHCDSVLEFGGITVEEYEEQYLNSKN